MLEKNQYGLISYRNLLTLKTKQSTMNRRCTINGNLIKSYGIKGAQNLNKIIQKVS